MTALLTYADPVPMVRDERVEFDTFYAASCQRLTLQLLAYLGDLAEAQSAVDEAFCRALAKWKSIRRNDDPVAWVRRTAWDLAPKTSRRGVTSTDPLTRALATLPAADRRVVVLHFMARLSVVDIAAQDRVAEGTIAGRLSRGKAALATALTAPEGNL